MEGRERKGRKWKVMKKTPIYIHIIVEMPMKEDRVSKLVCSDSIWERKKMELKGDISSSHSVCC